MLMSGFTDSTFQYNEDLSILNQNQNMDNIFDEELNELYLTGFNTLPASTPTSQPLSTLDSSYNYYTNTQSLSTQLPPNSTSLPADELSRSSTEFFDDSLYEQQPQQESLSAPLQQQLELLTQSQLHPHSQQPQQQQTTFIPTIVAPTSSSSSTSMFPPASACSPPPSTRSLTITRRQSIDSELESKSSFTITPYSDATELAIPPYQSTFTDPYAQQQLQHQHLHQVLSSPFLEQHPKQFFEDNVHSIESETDLSSDGAHLLPPSAHLHNSGYFKPRVSLDSFQSRRYELIRGTSAGGAISRPPQCYKFSPGFEFLKCELTLVDADHRYVCSPAWAPEEMKDRRRIIRVERRQHKNEVIASFSILGAAESNLESKPAPEGVDVVEVSCLESACNRSFADDDETMIVCDSEATESQLDRKYYITSVEVIKIVELLIGSSSIDAREKRKERGRIRSNLVPFWSRKPISSKRISSSTTKSPGKTNSDLRNELAQRIMSYEVRKPRGFDKEVRILEWNKLFPALRRALQSYYAKIPVSDL